MSSQDFNDLHPRNRLGEFTDKPGAGPSAESDAALVAGPALPDLSADDKVIAEALVANWERTRRLGHRGPGDLESFDALEDSVPGWMSQVDLAADQVRQWTHDKYLPEFTFLLNADSRGVVDGATITCPTKDGFHVASYRNPYELLNEGDENLSGRECARSITETLVREYRALVEFGDKHKVDFYRF